MLRRPLPWPGRDQPRDVRTLAVSGESLYGEAIAAYLHANDGIDVVGVALDLDEAVEAIDALVPAVVVVDVGTLPRVLDALLERCHAHTAVRVVLLGVPTGVPPTPGASPEVDVVVPSGSALERVVTAVRQAGGTAGPATRGAGPATDAGLSDRETEVLRLLAERNSTAEIAAILHLSTHTVRNHVRKLLHKLDVRNRTEAILEATRRGLL